MLKIVKITHVNCVAVSVKFNNGVIRHYDAERRTWIASIEETRIIEGLLKKPFRGK